MRRFLTKRNIVLLVVLAIGLGWWWNSRNRAQEGDEIREAIVTRGEIVSALSVSGKIEAEKTATLNFSGSGKVAYLGVIKGETVDKYQVMSYLDMGDLDAAATKAYYSYLAADAAAKKVEDDLKNKGASESFSEKNTRVAAQTTRDIAYDAWLTAQRAVKNAKLVAPFAGIVTNITMGGVGDTASVTDGITVVDPESLYFSAEVDEQDVGKVKIGQSVNVELDAFEGEVISGEIADIGFTAQISSTGATAFPVKVKFAPEILSKLRLGMNGDAEIVLETKSGILKLPYEAVIDERVWVVEGDKEIEKTVKIGIESEAEVEITEGLSEGEKVRIK